jgi:hypothetical protein
MSLASSLVALGDGRLPTTFEGLRSHLPLEWIESCLAKQGFAALRRRKLPVENVVWLVVGMALFRDRSIAEIVQRLDLVLPDEEGRQRDVARGAITPARDRLGVEPLRKLFEITAKRWSDDSAARYPWRGLTLLGIDGTTLRVPDSEENRRIFEAHSGSNYPMVRLATLMALRSRIAMDCSFSGCRTGESTLAKELLVSIPDHSLTILDRYFHDYSIWHAIRTSGENRQWLVRARDDLRVWKTIERFGPGDELAEIRVTGSTRKKHPELPETLRIRVISYRRAGFKTRTLVTSLLDPKLYPAREVAELYHERWELELAYDEIKTQTLDRREAIRSQSPDRVRQEILGLMIAYNLVRKEMEGMALKLELPANRISFQATLMMMRDLFYWAEVASPGKLPLMLGQMRLKLETFVLPPRRQRRYPRVTKMRVGKYGLTKERKTQGS